MNCYYSIYSTVDQNIFISSAFHALCGFAVPRLPRVIELGLANEMGIKVVPVTLLEKPFGRTLGHISEKLRKSKLGV